ncbi:MAG TPA: hypothetical protein ENG35_05805 [Desulfobacteraceae bacterium]|nr:hypothetical protein [Desulfobacteraceae bacterium]
MKFFKAKDEDLNLGFENPAPGTSVCVIGDDIRLLRAKDAENWDGEKRGETYIIPLRIVKALLGGKDNEGMEFRWMINVVKNDGSINKIAIKTFSYVLTHTGLIEKFMEKFADDDMGLNHPKVVRAIQTALPGKKLIVVHILTKSKKTDAEFVNVKTIRPAKNVNMDAEDDVGNDAEDDVDDVDDVDTEDSWE